jgi:hypothetical protein
VLIQEVLKFLSARTTALAFDERSKKFPTGASKLNQILELLFIDVYGYVHHLLEEVFRVLRLLKVLFTCLVVKNDGIAKVQDRTSPDL